MFYAEIKTVTVKRFIFIFIIYIYFLFICFLFLFWVLFGLYCNAVFSVRICEGDHCEQCLIFCWFWEIRRGHCIREMDAELLKPVIFAAYFCNG